jgi:TonB family protein
MEFIVATLERKEIHIMKELSDFFSPAVFSKNKFRNRRFTLAGVMLLGLTLAVAATTISANEYEASDVDSPPKLVRQMPIKYPSQAKKDGITGKVVVRCLIGADGKTAKMEVVESEPVGIFDDSALSTLKYWQFRPGVKQGEMVATWVKVPIKFE